MLHTILFTEWIARSTNYLTADRSGKKKGTEKVKIHLILSSEGKFSEKKYRFTCNTFCETKEEKQSSNVRVHGTFNQPTQPVECKAIEINESKNKKW